MDRLENALYLIVRDKINRTNYTEFNNLLTEYKAVYDMKDRMDPTDNTKYSQEIINHVNNIKAIYKKFNILQFNENIELKYNEILNDTITSSYNITRIQQEKQYNVDKLTQPLYKYKIGYLMKSNNINITKPITIDVDNNLDLSDIKNENITKIGNALNKLISGKNIHIQNILNCIFDINPNYFKIDKNDTGFNELTIPGRIITCIDDNNDETNNKIKLQMYKDIYLNLSSQRTNDNISNVQFIKFISDNIHPFNVDDIQNNLNDMDIKSKFVKIDDIELTDSNINNVEDIKTFEDWNKKIFEKLKDVLNIKEHTTNINNILNTNIFIEIGPPDNIKYEIPFKSILQNLNTKTGQLYFDINEDSFNNYFKNKYNAVLQHLKFAPDNYITNLGDGMFMNINKILNKYLNDDINDIKIKGILGTDVLSKLLGKNNDEEIDKKHIDKYCSIVFKNTVDKTEVFQKLLDIFKNYDTDDTKFIKLFYSIAYQNKQNK